MPLCKLPFFSHHHGPTARPGIDCEALQKAARSNSAEAQAMQAQVASRLSEVPVQSLAQTQRLQNAIMLQAAAAAFLLHLFANDCWGAWIIRCRKDLEQARLDLELILEALETLKTTINDQKNHSA